MADGRRARTPARTWSQASRSEREWWLGPVSGVDNRTLARRKYSNLPEGAKERLGRSHRVADATFKSYRRRK